MPRWDKSPLTVEEILAWADAYRRLHGRWPASRCGGPVPGAPGLTWEALNVALRDGWRGLPGGWSLRLLLAERRDAPDGRSRPRKPGKRAEVARLREQENLTFRQIAERVGG